MDFLLLAVLFGIVFVAIDTIWLKSMKLVYTNAIGNILLLKPNVTAAIIFYIIYILGVVLFVLQPAIHSQGWTYALIHGAALGFVAYSTYDLTNAATLKKWPVKIVAIDIIWGSAATSFAAVAGYFMATSWLGL